MQASSSSPRPLAPSSCVTCGLLAPCRRALARLFRIPASAALSVRAFRFRTLRRAASKMSPRRHRRRRRRTFRSVRAVFWPLAPAQATTATFADQGDSATARRVAPEAATEDAAVHAPAPLPSPETPVYVKMVARLRSRRSGGEEEAEEEEGACRSFESRLMEMLLEEGKVRDLQDVEELLRCWERLKSPVFVELVCRFYGELCKDLFSPDQDAGSDEATSSTPAGGSSS
ncbi:hypothetical protein E2562_032480 [Oryza meyeriana var. granulata]|uniref:OVATE domain-containing protein n=1 Tax=Oryza meyeriana var. granulata TaxID=110450 RepID=A0A6G1ERY8_9ORYZ|nr:hypothetical protein E2562_032480 [Oryza meyeriana var. granulata]